MKYLAHVPTEQYGFISVEVEGTAEDVVEAYKDLQTAWNPVKGIGLASREFCRFIDCYIGTGKPPRNGMDLWQSMDEKQRYVVNELKKSLARFSRNN